MRAIVRSDDEDYLSSAVEFKLLNCKGELVVAGPMQKWGRSGKASGGSPLQSGRFQNH